MAETIEVQVWACLKERGPQTVREIAIVTGPCLARLIDKTAAERSGWSVRSKYRHVGDSPPSEIGRRIANLTQAGRLKGVTVRLAKQKAAKARVERKQAVHPRPVPSHALDQAMGWFPVSRFLSQADD
jgi:hypothetical protein